MAAHCIVPSCAIHLGRTWRTRPARLCIPKEDTMRRISFCFLILTVLDLNFMPSSQAQDSPDHQAPAMTSATPTSAFRAEFLEEIAYYEQRYTRLAEAMPAEKYVWRPAEGVRSAGDVFAHAILANHGIARALRTAPPTGFGT